MRAHHTGVHPEPTRVAVLADLATGMSIAAIARRHGVDRRTVVRWRQAVGLGEATTLMDPKERHTLAELIADYLGEVLHTLTAQARAARDPDWLAGQNARDLAILHGVLNDKAVRLLAALEPDEQPA